MSKANHPNFHAVGFATNVISEYYNSLRGQANPENCPDISELIESFVKKVEEKVDHYILFYSKGQVERPKPPEPPAAPAIRIIAEDGSKEK